MEENFKGKVNICEFNLLCLRRNGIEDYCIKVRLKIILIFVRTDYVGR